MCRPQEAEVALRRCAPDKSRLRRGFRRFARRAAAAAIETSVVGIRV
ncbi:hypothetical protein LC55x_2387 [Lysobacter capsici]|nr:hypothetical protein LC55x_2387 [Lysobacter capsici]